MLHTTHAKITTTCATMSIMRKRELFVKISVVILALLAVGAVILQILNEETGPIETIYEVMTFSVAAIALMLAIMQGVYNARTTNELKKIVHELKQVIEAEKTELNQETELNEKIGKLLKEE
jgi:uncharacterized membrane protein (DUF485 family)